MDKNVAKGEHARFNKMHICSSKLSNANGLLKQLDNIIDAKKFLFLYIITLQIC